MRCTWKRTAWSAARKCDEDELSPARGMRSAPPAADARRPRMGPPLMDERCLGLPGAAALFPLHGMGPMPWEAMAAISARLCGLRRCFGGEAYSEKNSAMVVMSNGDLVMATGVLGTC